MMGAVRVRNTELEGSGDEVLQGETHNLSQFAVGAPCFVTDVMMSPLPCHDVTRRAVDACARNSCLLLTNYRKPKLQSRAVVE